MKRRTLLGATTGLVGLGLTREAFAQNAPRPMIVSSGGKGGTYHRLVEELNGVCPGQIENKESDGSLSNIDRVINNQAEMGITQLDALVLRGQRERDLRERIRVLAVLHPEEVHFIAKAAGRSEGGWGSSVGVNLDIGASTVYLRSVSDLKARKVGFWGGSIVTEQIISSMALPGWAPVELKDQATALNELKNDRIDAILAVGGQPLGWVSQLGREYALLEVSDSMVGRLSAVYDRATLTYRNLGQDGVTALAVSAMLVTRNYATRTMRDRLQKLRECMVQNVPEIRETRDTHPKWMVIDPAATTDKWQMYLTPTAAR